MIEPSAARLAAERAKVSDLKKLNQFINEMNDVVHHHKLPMATELDFHCSIAKATKNPVVMRIIPVIMDAIIKTYRDAPRKTEDHQAALEEHRRILAGIEAHNPEEAQAAMRYHLEETYKRTIKRGQLKQQKNQTKTHRKT